MKHWVSFWGSHYKIDYSHKIEEGGFGKIYLAKNTRTGHVLACKVIRKDKIPDHLYHNMIHEGILLKSLKHPNIIKVHHIKETPDDLIIYMDYFPRKDLYNFLNDYDHISEKVAYRIMSQVVDAVDYLHKHHILHRDLKLENILYDLNMNVVLIDFGFAIQRSPKDPLLTYPLGSKLYAAPELLKGDPYNGYASDIWALGVCLFLLIIGKYPFDTPDQIVSQELTITAKISPEVSELLYQLLDKDPEARPSTSTIQTSKWFMLWK